MPRYHLHLHMADRATPDRDGTLLSDSRAARAEAVARARAIIARDARRGTVDLRHWIAVETDRGEPVLTVRFADVVDVLRRR